MSFTIHFIANDITKKYYGIIYNEIHNVFDVSTNKFVEIDISSLKYHTDFKYKSFKNFTMELPSVYFPEGKYSINIMSHDSNEAVNYGNNNLETVVDGIWNPILAEFVDIRHANTYYTGKLSTFDHKTQEVVASNFTDEFSKKSYDVLSKVINAKNFFVNVNSANGDKFGFVNLAITTLTNSIDIMGGWTGVNFDLDYNIQFRDGLYNEIFFTKKIRLDQNNIVNIVDQKSNNLISGDFSIIISDLSNKEIVKGTTRISGQSYSVFPKPDLSGGINVGIKRGSIQQRISIRGVQN
jgi:hypothetical protein